MRFLCWITKATKPRSHYLILTATRMIIKHYFPARYNTVTLFLSLLISHSDGPLGAFHVTLNNTLQNIPHLISIISQPQAVSSNSKTVRISKFIFFTNYFIGFIPKCFGKQIHLSH